MRTALLVLAAPLLVSVASAQTPDPAWQIRAAVSPAPEDQREAATVHGYDDQGRFVELRRGDGELVCLADDPSDERFHVACYHASLEPFMARGRELRANGVESADVKRMRGEEIASGKLPFPTGPAALYSLTGPPGSFDAESQAVRGGTRVYSIYIANATAAATGLPTAPMHDGGPWLMSAGEPWAHIMVVQPSDPPAPPAD